MSTRTQFGPAPTADPRFPRITPVVSQSIARELPGSWRAAAVSLVVGSLLLAGAPLGALERGDLCEHLRGGRSPYFGRAFLDEIRAALDASSDPAEESGYRGLLGAELLKHGQLDEALELLEQAKREIATQERSDGLASSVDWHLALAHLRLAEQQNCVGHRSAASCILPIRKDAVHTLPEHSRRAGDLFAAYAKEHPRNIQAVWLLNVARRVAGQFPDGVPAPLRITDEQLTADGAAFAYWTDRGPELGLSTLDLAGGAIMDDFDGDGHLDLVSSTWDPCGGLAAFRNNGTGGFEDVTDLWGLADLAGGLNLVHGDVDGDGWLDLLVLRGAWLLADGQIPNTLLRNRGPLSTAAGDVHKRFEDITATAGLEEPGYPTASAAFADFDGDGDLDLFVGNEATKASSYPSQLFQNDGRGRFMDIASSSGVSNLRYSKGVAWGDFDEDGDPDLYVSNFGENRLYRNDGATPSGDGWQFVDVAPELGVVAPRVESFASWFFDYDNDGDLDLFVADYRSQAARVTASYFGMATPEGQPLLYQNQFSETGSASFREVSRSVGLVRPAMPMGANYGDLDNDGWLDIYLGTGEPDLASLMPNVMYRNTGGRFVDITMAGGFGHLQKGHGVALGDLDHDGDQDLFHQLGGFYPGDRFGNALFENPTANPREAAGAGRNRFLTLHFEGRRANRFALGARVEIVVLDAATPAVPRSIHLLVGAGGSFGGSSLRQEVGLGKATQVREVIVRWPGSGVVDRFRDLELDRVYLLREGGSSATEGAAAPEGAVALVVTPFRLGGD